MTKVELNQLIALTEKAIKHMDKKGINSEKVNGGLNRIKLHLKELQDDPFTNTDRIHT